MNHDMKTVGFYKNFGKIKDENADGENTKKNLALTIVVIALGVTVLVAFGLLIGKYLFKKRKRINTIDDEYDYSGEINGRRIIKMKKIIEKGNKEAAEKELGDLLFAIVNAARLYHINPDTALEHTNRKFITRFEYIEKKAKSMGRNIKDLTLEEMDRLWNEAKSVLLCIMTIFAIVACTNTTRPNMDIEDEMVGVPDSAIYGTVGDATSMHVLTIVTDNGREMAVAMNQDTIPSDIQGGLYAGDNICVTTMPDPSDPKRGMKVVAKAVNLTSLLGHWISLDRNFTMKENGIIEAKNNIESKPYTSWQMRNCQLILNT